MHTSLQNDQQIRLSNGHHSFRSFRIHKECFGALVQLRIENITNFRKNIEADLYNSLKDLRRNPSSDNLDVLMLKSFENLFNAITVFEKGTEAHFTVM